MFFNQEEAKIIKPLVLCLLDRIVGAGLIQTDTNQSMNVAWKKVTKNNKIIAL